MMACLGKTIKVQRVVLKFFCQAYGSAECGFWALCVCVCKEGGGGVEVQWQKKETGFCPPDAKTISQRATANNAPNGKATDC